MKMLLLQLRDCNKDGEEEPFLERYVALNTLALTAAQRYSCYSIASQWLHVS